MKQKIFDINNFSLGLMMLEDESNTPVGSARVMRNMWISDRKGITKRPGTELLGTVSTVNDGIHGLFNYKKSNGQDEILIKAYDDELEYYHDTAGWTRIKNGYTTSREFGFKDHNVNTENEDYVYFCNAKENYSRWPGTYETVQTAAAGGATTLEVESTIYPNVFASGTASSGTATVLGIASSAWAVDQWIDFYMKTTSGQMRRITDNTSTSLTFDAMSSAFSAGESFTIVKNKFAPTGTLQIGNVTNAYSAIPYSTAFTVTATTGAITTGTPVTVLPSIYPANPKGNKMDTLFTRMYVGGVQGAGLAYSTANALQGSYSPASIYYAKIKNATDFTFTATRVAGEGGIESYAYGSGPITDVACQEESVYVFKKDQVESLQHEQSSSDMVLRTPISTVLGSVNKVVKGSNDIYFATQDNQITSLSRVAQKDLLPQNVNVGYKIKRLLDTYNMEDFNGIKYKNRLFFTLKVDSTENDRVLVYNEVTQGFEGEWTLGAYGFTVNQGDLYYGQSTTPNVYKMLTGFSDAQGTDTFGITGIWKSNWINLTASKANMQAINAVVLEGYIQSDSTLNFELYKDWSDTAIISFDFTGTETDFITSANFSNALGLTPLGTAPLGTIGDPDPSGKRHFQFIVYFPFQYGNFFSFGFNISGKNESPEIIRCGLGIKEDTMFNNNIIKTI